jgi:hypothetical protein
MAFKFEMGQQVKSTRGNVMGLITARSEWEKYPSQYHVEWVDEKHEPRETWFAEHEITAA